MLPRLIFRAFTFLACLMPLHTHANCVIRLTIDKIEAARLRIQPVSAEIAGDAALLEDLIDQAAALEGDITNSATLMPLVGDDPETARLLSFHFRNRSAQRNIFVLADYDEERDTTAPVPVSLVFVDQFGLVSNVRSFAVSLAAFAGSSPATPVETRLRWSPRAHSPLRSSQRLALHRLSPQTPPFAQTIASAFNRTTSQMTSEFDQILFQVELTAYLTDGAIDIDAQANTQMTGLSGVLSPTPLRSTLIEVASGSRNAATGILARREDHENFFWLRHGNYFYTFTFGFGPVIRLKSVVNYRQAQLPERVSAFFRESDREYAATQRLTREAGAGVPAQPVAPPRPTYDIAHFRALEAKLGLIARSDLPDIFSRHYIPAHELSLPQLRSTAAALRTTLIDPKLSALLPRWQTFVDEIGRAAYFDAPRLLRSLQPVLPGLTSEQDLGEPFATQLPGVRTTLGIARIVRQMARTNRIDAPWLREFFRWFAMQQLIHKLEAHRPAAETFVHQVELAALASDAAQRQISREAIAAARRSFPRFALMENIIDAWSERYSGSLDPVYSPSNLRTLLIFESDISESRSLHAIAGMVRSTWRIRHEINIPGMLAHPVTRQAANDLLDALGTDVPNILDSELDGIRVFNDQAEVIELKMSISPTGESEAVKLERQLTFVARLNQFHDQYPDGPIQLGIPRHITVVRYVVLQRMPSVARQALVRVVERASLANHQYAPRVVFHDLNEVGPVINMNQVMVRLTE